MTAVVGPYENAKKAEERSEWKIIVVKLLTKDDK